jgi:hypothetical protein
MDLEGSGSGLIEELSRNFDEEIEERDEKPQSGYPRFEPSTSGIQVQSAIAYSNTLSNIL